MKTKFFRYFLLSLVVLARVAYGATLAEIELAFEKGFAQPRYQLSDVDLTNIGTQLNTSYTQYERVGFFDPEKTRDFVLSVFSDGRLQEGIWILDRLGLIAEAEWFS